MRVSQILAGYHPTINLLGVSTVAGNQTLDLVTQNALKGGTPPGPRRNQGAHVCLLTHHVRESLARLMAYLPTSPPLLSAPLRAPFTSPPFSAVGFRAGPCARPTSPLLLSALLRAPLTSPLLSAPLRAPFTSLQCCGCRGWTTCASCAAPPSRCCALRHVGVGSWGGRLLPARFPHYIVPRLIDGCVAGRRVPLPQTVRMRLEMTQGLDYFPRVHAFSRRPSLRR